MERKEFIHLLGLGAGAVVVHGCLGACGKGKSPIPAPDPKADFIITNIEANADMVAKGWMVQNSIIIAKLNGNYYAVSAICTHEGNPISFNGSNFICPTHISSFSLDGAWKSGPATSLPKYNTELIGSDLRVFGG